MKKVGLTAYLTEDINSTFEKYDVIRIADNYIQSVVKIGAVPIILPVVVDEKIIKSQLKGIHILILSGGEDVSPHFYKEEFLKKCGNPCVTRDLYEMKLIKYALELRIPILGICRGAQILNVALGGSLYQDLSYIKSNRIKHDNVTNQSYLSHKIKISPNSFLGDIYGEEIWTNSFHHQSVKELGKGLKVIARSTDRIIEGFEGLINNTLVLGVQWHPEMLAAKNDEQMLKLFNTFINNKN